MTKRRWDFIANLTDEANSLTAGSHPDQLTQSVESLGCGSCPEPPHQAGIEVLRC